MTIPTLVMNYKKNTIEARLKKFYSAMNQAINLSEINNGEKSNWHSQIVASEECSNGKHESEECLNYFFEIYLKPYLSYTKYNFGYEGFVVYFTDGSCLRIKHPWDYYFYPTASDKEKSDVKGKTVFPFQMDQNFTGCKTTIFKNKGLEPFITDDWDCTERGLYNSPYNSTKLIQINGWKIPDDYPWLK